jgi:hypothetical protein
MGPFGLRASFISQRKKEGECILYRDWEPVKITSPLFLRPQGTQFGCKLGTLVVLPKLNKSGDHIGMNIISANMINNIQLFLYLQGTVVLWLMTTITLCMTSVIIPLCIFPNAGCTLKQSWKALRCNNKDIGHSTENVQNQFV